MNVRAIAAGSVYFLIVFAAGFVLGSVRTFLVAPEIGETAAVMLEIPLMLTIAWFACGWAVKKAKVPRRVADRILMGAIALMLLLIAEALLSVTLAGLTLGEHLAGYAQAGPLIGLAAQTLYACFPIIQGRRTATGHVAGSG